jgi:hypothetical protein
MQSTDRPATAAATRLPPRAASFPARLTLGLGFLIALGLGCASTEEENNLQAELDKALKEQKTRVAAVCHPAAVEPCYTGPEGTAGRGICREGTRECDANGQWLSCTGEALPARELCNETDDDCNGITDDGFKRAGTKCFSGEGACRSDGIYRCSADQTKSECDAPIIPPSDEICDGKDNDCDGEVDEGAMSGTGDSCGTGQKGVCAVGLRKCVAGEIKCVPQTVPSIEICESKLDEDCDGTTDEKECTKASDVDAAKAGR